jgi:hypothetical protein
LLNFVIFAAIGQKMNAATEACSKQALPPQAERAGRQPIGIHHFDYYSN